MQRLPTYATNRCWSEVVYHDQVSWLDRSDRINHRTPRLLWLQVADDLKAMMESRELQPGAKLPGEAELAETYGVSRDTIRRATQELASEGLVVILHGRGTFIAERE
jgi:DNA-binding GntR family transcriptional regulator